MRAGGRVQKESELSQDKILETKAARRLRSVVVVPSLECKARQRHQ
jgi:hypothetical protein